MKKFEHPSWAEVDLKAIKHNFRALQKLAGKKTEIMPVIKADAYGHGIEAVARALRKSGVKFFGVSDVAEGIALRKCGIKSPVLLFESTLPTDAKDIVKYGFIPTLCTWKLALALNRQAQRENRKMKVHINVDTGMGRLGINYDDAEKFIRKIHALPYLKIDGLYTHFPVADSTRSFTSCQINLLSRLAGILNQQGIKISHIHAANSMGVLGYKHQALNLARPGLMLYGLYPDSGLKRKVKLKPAMSVKSQVVLLKDIARGRKVGYGHTFTARRNMKVAVVPIGYNDGYFRILSNQSHVLIKGRRCPVIGRVTMDQIIVDTSNVTSVRLGDPVVIIGSQGKGAVSADELASRAKTINYEVVCSLGNRLPRIYTINKR